MANALERGIQEGERLVLTDGTKVKAKGGFGMQAFTMGSAIFVENEDGAGFRIDGLEDIDVEATKKLQAETH